MGFLVREYIAGGAFIVIVKMSNSVLKFRSVSRVEVVDLRWAECSKERNAAVTRVVGTCTFPRVVDKKAKLASKLRQPLEA